MKLFLNALTKYLGGLLLVGVLLFLPQYIRSGNKDGRTLSRFDGVLMGIAGAFSVFPGISRISMVSTSLI